MGMIISHRHRFIFIKTRKTAGTSIEIFLSQHAGEDAIVTPILPHVEPHRARNHEGFVNHIKGSAIRERVGSDVWENYFRFCVERNPWDKTLSYYHMQKFRSGGTLTLEQYLESDDWCVDHPAYTEPDDPTRLLVHRVLRYERLTEDLTELFGQLGVPFTGSLGVLAKSEYRDDRRPYREVFTPGQAARVGDAFRVERELFGYGY